MKAAFRRRRYAAALAQFLLATGYRVLGLLRRSASSDIIGERLRWLGILEQVELLDGDMSDLGSLIRILEKRGPDEVYNLAAQSFVASSWQQPLLPGMIVSDEPGYYKAGAFGIRIENLVVVEPRAGSGEREVLGFDTLTLAPIEFLGTIADGLRNIIGMTCINPQGTPVSRQLFNVK